MRDTRSIVVVRALGGLGDFLCAVPALQALRSRYPDSRITLIGMPQTRSLVGRYPHLIDEFVDFPGFPGVIEMPCDAMRLAAFLEDWHRREPFDLSVQMHGSGGVTNSFTALLGARQMLAYHVPGTWQPSALTLPFPDHLSEMARWSALVDSIGCPPTNEPILQVTEADRAALRHEVPEITEQRYAVVHAGASDPVRRWPVGGFAEVCTRLSNNGLQVVLTGTADERDIIAPLAQRLGERAINLCGRTSLGGMAALVEAADLVVTNDTGTAHLAAAIDTPSVVIFIASDPRRWAPADRQRHRVVGQGVPDAIIGVSAPRLQPSRPETSEVIAAIDSAIGVAA